MKKKGFRVSKIIEVGVPSATMFSNQPTSGPHVACRVTTAAAAAAASDAGDEDAPAANDSSAEPEKPLQGPSVHSSPGKLSRSALEMRNNTNADIMFAAKMSKEEATR